MYGEDLGGKWCQRSIHSNNNIGGKSECENDLRVGKRPIDK